MEGLKKETNNVKKRDSEGSVETRVKEMENYSVH